MALREHQQHAAILRAPHHWVRFSDPSVYDGEINPSKDELDGGRFWTLEEIRAAIGQQTLTPNFESEFQRFFL